eukprot:461434-Pelagomonas_calceolata.AAC.22
MPAVPRPGALWSLLQETAGVALQSPSWPGPGHPVGLYPRGSEDHLALHCAAGTAVGKSMKTLSFSLACDAALHLNLMDWMTSKGEFPPKGGVYAKLYPERASKPASRRPGLQLAYHGMRALGTS